jgi:5-methylcytosine-specific restriction protein A
MPTATICLDCNALFPEDRTIRAYGRCPACRPAYLEREANRPGRHRRHATPARALAQSFYDSTEWKKVRELARRRDGACTRCGTNSDLTVHHVHSRRTHPHLALDVDNLTTLCRSCHGAIENAQRRAR